MKLDEGPQLIQRGALDLGWPFRVVADGDKRVGPSFSISTSLLGMQAACARAVTWVRQLLSPRAILRDGLSYEPSTTPHPSPQALGRW